jgi:hypothetical protein
MAADDEKQPSPDSAKDTDTIGAKMLRERRIRQQNDALTLALIIVFLVGAILALTFANDLAIQFTSRGWKENIPENTTIIRFLAAGTLVMVFGVVTYLYAAGSPIFRLRTNSPDLSRDLASDARAIDLESLATALDAITKATDEIKNNRYITDGDRNVISAQLTQLARDSLPKEYFAKIEEKYGSTIRDEKLSNYVEEFMGRTKARLAQFQLDLSRKAASSLAWGLVTAVIGLLVLGIFIYVPPQGTWDIGTAFHLVARLGLVAIIEVVAFFFLSQYRFTLQDEKYVNNEVTNVELRLLSIIAAAKLGSKGALEKALGELSRSERNFALKKGEVSVFQNNSGADLLQSAVVADLVGRLVPTIPGPTSRRKPAKDKD